mmetsp:Transcript_18976/g.43071  ORF Transcript_18976/g.43071 Transcript_18976/m.43071 type:complete len:257 (+) Transcript_18976:53-823(+)
MSHDRRYDCEDQHDPRKQFDLIRVFPAAFTICCLLLFTAPVVKCIDLAFDRDCAFWMGHAPQVIAFIPPVFVGAAHVVHLVKKKPNRAAVVGANMGSCLILLCLFERYMGRGTELSSHFISTDCRSFPRKEAMERQWQAAHTFYSRCLSENGDAWSFMIEDCPGYKAQLDKHAHWEYLAGLERRHLCGGWCQPGPQLWGFAETPGARCSAIVGEVMQAKVERVGTQLFVYCLLVLFLTLGVLIYLGPVIRNLGVSW